MLRLSRGQTRNFTLSKDTPPALRVAQGESFVLETEDSSAGFVKSEKDLPTPENLRPSSEFDPPKRNPLSGPVYIEGVERGDLLVVNIEKIVPAEQGATWIYGSGIFKDSKKWPELGEASVHIIRHKPGPSGTTRDGKAFYNDRIVWQMRPFIGTIGVAPDFEVESSLTGQGKWGGNWDCRDMKEGTKLYLNCYHEGGLLYVGDVHGTQGDGEWTGVANETEAEVTLSCTAIKQKTIPYPRLEKEESIVSLYAARPLEDAVQTAIINLMDWLVTEYGMEPRDVYFQLSVNPDFRINVYQMVKAYRLQYTVGAEFPKKYL